LWSTEKAFTERERASVVYEMMHSCLLSTLREESSGGGNSTYKSYFIMKMETYIT